MEFTMLHLQAFKVKGENIQAGGKDPEYGNQFQGRDGLLQADSLQHEFETCRKYLF